MDLPIKRAFVLAFALALTASVGAQMDYSATGSSGSSDMDMGTDTGGNGASGTYTWTSETGVAMVGAGAGEMTVAESRRQTVTNRKCDEQIAMNLRNHSDERFTQPVVPIRINTQLIIISLNDVIDVTGVVSLTAQIEFRWNDSRLFLESNGTCNNESLLIQTNRIWFPYFIVQNGADNVFYPDAWDKFPSSLASDGHIEWTVAFKLDLTCDMDFTLFPFDTQYCRALIQSPHYGNSELFYNVSHPDYAAVLFNLKDSNHPMWQIKGQTYVIKTQIPGILFYFSLERKFMYYIWTIAIPVLAVCILTASTFVITAEGSEKMATVLNGLISFFLLYLLFVNAIPADSTNTPLLMIFFSVQIILTALSVIMSSVVQRVLSVERAEKEVVSKYSEKPSRIESVSAQRRPSIFQQIGNAASSLYSVITRKRRIEAAPDDNQAEEGLTPVKADDNAEGPEPARRPDTSKPKKEQRSQGRLVSARLLNEIILVAYIAIVIVSILAFIGNLGHIYTSSKAPLNFTDIKTYAESLPYRS